jgi:hypothetical protein
MENRTGKQNNSSTAKDATKFHLHSISNKKLFGGHYYKVLVQCLLESSEMRVMLQIKTRTKVQLSREKRS